MAQRVAAETAISAGPDEVYAVIADLEAYPQWADDVVRTEVLERDGDLARVVAFEVDARIALVHYVLEYQHDPPYRVRWRLLEGELLRRLHGSYRLAPDDGTTTNVRYELDAELSLPLPAQVQRRAAQAILDTGLEGLRQRVEAR